MKKIILILVILLNISLAHATVATFDTATGPVTIDVGDPSWWAANINSFNDSAAHFTAAVEAAAAEHGGSAIVNGVIVCANSGDLNTNTNTSTSNNTTTVDTTSYDPGPSCGSCIVTNACGQVFTGDDCSGICNAGAGIDDINSSCIGDFTCGNGSISPNGSIDCSWNIKSGNGINSLCGFYDLTTPTPRPIPGLQNLDINTNKARISNIQSTTRFCLICKFYNIVNNNSLLGSASSHQWVKVVRIGEQ